MAAIAAANKIAMEPAQPGDADQVGFTLAPGLVALDDEVNARTEAFRGLRTHIMARHVGEGRRSIVICGPTPAVGCTLVAANLAVALSQIGVNTLLVDANLREPALDKIFRPSAPVTGLQQCLAGDEGFAEYIQHDVLPHLSVLFAGGATLNPQELLASERFASLMSFCLREFDMTVVDTPPANSCSDAHRVSTVAGYSLIVARKDKTLVSDVRVLVDQLENDYARVIGTVLTED
jgi:capsular exopolysaccharide synthesis family protein